GGGGWGRGGGGERSRATIMSAVGSLAVFDPLLITGGYGAETFLYVALILNAFLLLDSRHQVLAGCLLGLAVVCRGDAAVAAAVYLLVWALRHRRLPVQAGLACCAVAGTWASCATLYYRTPWPQTLAVKRMQAAVWDGRFLDGIPFYAARFLGQSRWIAVMAPLAVIGLLRVLRRRLVVPGALALWAGSYLAAFAVLNVPYVYIWYYSVVSPLVVILAGLGLVGLARQKRPWGAMAAAAAWGVTLVSFAQCGAAFGRWLPYPRHPVYVEAAMWIKTDSSQDATVAAFEVGAVGYVSQRHIIDLWGLVTPGVARHTLAQGDGTWALRR
ncbi:hypothetical protein JXA88_01075, partial [Candidatus Fermentibacteria bacterium]|nr:hypothetical protein [Candidatus Fermentibacteria bacterium]